MHRLPEMLGIPVVPVSARKKRGLDVLMHAVAHHADQAEPVLLIHDHEELEEASQHQHDHHAEYAMVYSDLIEDKIDAVIDVLKQRYPEMKNYRWHVKAAGTGSGHYGPLSGGSAASAGSQL